MASKATLRAVSTPMVISEPQRSLSMVEATPTTGTPSWERAYAPFWEPFPPITTRASIPKRSKTSTAFFRPSGVLNSGQRALPKMVPPSWMIPPTSRGTQGPDLARKEARIAPANSPDFPALGQAGPHHGPDGRVHPGRIAPACEDTDPFKHGGKGCAGRPGSRSTRRKRSPGSVRKHRPPRKTREVPFPFPPARDNGCRRT
jgi:hypothetical protein